MSEDNNYAAAETGIKNAIAQYAAGTHTDPGAPARRLYPQAVTITGAPRNITGNVVTIGGTENDSKPRERLDLVVDFGNPQGTGAVTDLRAANEGEVRKAILTALKTSFGGVSLPGGGTLADTYNFSGEKPEAEKPMKEQLADLKKLVDAGIAEAQDAIPAEVISLLKHAKAFDPEQDSSIIYYEQDKPSIDKGLISLSFPVTSKNEGELSNVALVQKNITARKEEILAAIREKAIATHSASGASAEDMQKFKDDLGKLDLQTTILNNTYGESVVVQIGNKLKTPATAGQPAVDKTILAQLSEDKLTPILNDSILFKGQNASEVAHLIASASDVERFLEQYKDKAPSFAKALESEALASELPWAERMKLEKEQKKEANKKPIQPSVTMNTAFSDGQLGNEAHVNMELPDGVTHSQVIRALAGKAQTVDIVAQPVAPAVPPEANNNDVQGRVGFAQENLKAPLLTKPPASKVEQLQSQTPSAAGIAP